MRSRLWATTALSFSALKAGVRIVALGPEAAPGGPKALVQLVLENRPRNELEEVLAFCGEVGLPTTLADIGVVEVTDAKLRQVAEASCAAGESIHNEPFPVSREAVVAAIMAADAIGTAYKSE